MVNNQGLLKLAKSVKYDAMVINTAVLYACLRSSTGFVFCSARDNGKELYCESTYDFQPALNTRLASYYLCLHQNHSTDEYNYAVSPNKSLLFLN